MNDNISDSRNMPGAMITGFQKVSQTLKNIQTTVKHDGVTVTVTAEPTITNLEIDPSVNITSLPNLLTTCLNEAFKESSRKILLQATKELANS